MGWYWYGVGESGGGTDGVQNGRFIVVFPEQFLKSTLRTTYATAVMVVYSWDNNLTMEVFAA
jgi:hypothetical protein